MCINQMFDECLIQIGFEVLTTARHVRSTQLVVSDRLYTFPLDVKLIH